MGSREGHEGAAKLAGAGHGNRKEFGLPAARAPLAGDNGTGLIY